MCSCKIQCNAGRSLSSSSERGGHLVGDFADKVSTQGNYLSSGAGAFESKTGGGPSEKRMEWLPAVVKVLIIIICNFASVRQAAPPPPGTGPAEPPANTYIIITDWITKRAVLPGVRRIRGDPEIEDPHKYKLLTIGPNDYDLAKNYGRAFIIGPVVSREESTLNFPGGKIPARDEALPIQAPLGEPTIYARVRGGVFVKIDRASGDQKAKRDYENLGAKRISRAVNKAIEKIEVAWTDTKEFVTSKIPEQERPGWVVRGETNRYDIFSVYSRTFEGRVNNGGKLFAWAEFQFVRRIGSCIQRNRDLVEVAETIRDFLVENFYTRLLCDEQYEEIVAEWDQLELVIHVPKRRVGQERWSQTTSSSRPRVQKRESQTTTSGSKRTKTEETGS